MHFLYMGIYLLIYQLYIIFLPNTSGILKLLQKTPAENTAGAY